MALFVENKGITPFLRERDNLIDLACKIVQDHPIAEDLVQERLSFRLVTDLQTTDGFVWNPTRGVDDAAFRDKTTLPASLRYDRMDQPSAVLKYTNWSMSSGKTVSARSMRACPTPSKMVRT